MARLLIVLLFVIGCSSSKPKPPSVPEGRQYGYDVLGVARYCDRLLASPPVSYLSTLQGTFGNPLPCIERAIREWKTVRFVQVDLIDATCWRNRVCAPGVPHPEDLGAIERRAAEVQNYANVFPQVEWWVSPALEHDVKDPNKVRAMMQAAKRGCPKCKIINSPESGAHLPDYPSEHHGNVKKGFAVSNDGASIFDSDSVSYRTHGERFVAAWFPEMNGRTTGDKGFIMPDRRTCWPTADLMLQARLLLEESKEEDFPGVCKRRRNLEARELWKTNAESYSPCPHPDSRGNKYLFISRFTDRTLDLIDKRGNKVGQLGYYGTYSGDRGYHRHYIGGPGGSGESPIQMYNKVGGETLFVKRGDECIRVNTIRRKGYFR